MKDLFLILQGTMCYLNYLNNLPNKGENKYDKCYYKLENVTKIIPDNYLNNLILNYPNFFNSGFIKNLTDIELKSIELNMCKLSDIIFNC